MEQLYKWIKSKMRGINDVYWKHERGRYYLIFEWLYGEKCPIKLFKKAQYQDDYFGYLGDNVTIFLEKLSIENFFEKYGGKKLLYPYYHSEYITLPKDMIELEIESAL